MSTCASCVYSIIIPPHAADLKTQPTCLSSTYTVGATESCFPVGANMQLTGLAWLCSFFLSHLIAGKHDGGFVILLLSHEIFELEFVFQ